MSGDQTAQLLYLVLLGTAIAGYFFTSSRQNLSKTVQQAMIWALIFIGVVGAYGLWTDLSGTLNNRQASLVDGERIEVPKGLDGHFRLTLTVNDTPIEFLVDTGATNIVLTKSDAEKAGIDVGRLIFDGVARTANGTVETAEVWLREVDLAGLKDTRVPASVNGGELHMSLLGMSYLTRYAQVRID
ncbi:MAG: TIGR02281 family clan AA aspartic protease, partial [Planctomycetota bacterium]